MLCRQYSYVCASEDRHVYCRILVMDDSTKDVKWQD